MQIRCELDAICVCVLLGKLPSFKAILSRRLMPLDLSGLGRHLHQRITDNAVLLLISSIKWHVNVMMTYGRMLSSMYLCSMYLITCFCVFIILLHIALNLSASTGAASCLRKNSLRLQTLYTRHARSLFRSVCHVSESRTQRPSPEM